MESPFPDTPGTYVLVLQARRQGRIGIGALGSLPLQPGYYAYVGSARGPGGLAARLAHHRRRAPSPHWHIDYLRRHTRLCEVWYAQGERQLEHAWAQALAESPAAAIALARFGASDCRCRAHLFHFARLPRLPAFRRQLPASHPALVRWVAPQRP